MSTKRQSSKGKAVGGTGTTIDDKDTTNSYKTSPQKKTKRNIAEAAKKNDDNTDSTATTKEMGEQERQIAARKARRERMENLGLELSDGGSDDSEIDYASDSSLVPPWMMDSNSGGDDDVGDQDSSDEEDSSDDEEEYDWSGRPGYRCNICSRRSENVGPRRGFDYENSVCGGCC